MVVIGGVLYKPKVEMRKNGMARIRCPECREMVVIEEGGINNAI